MSGLLLFESNCFGTHFHFFALEALCCPVLKNACFVHYFTLLHGFGIFKLGAGIAHWQGFVSIGSSRLFHFISLQCFCIATFYFECSGSW